MDHDSAQQTPKLATRSAIYGSGALYSGGEQVIRDLTQSGFTTVILWSLHVHQNGDLFFNDNQIVTNGRYVGDSGWSARLATLKSARPSSVNRIEISIGSAGATDWENIRDLIARQGIGSDSILYRNFQALQTQIKADAINSDDESCYDVESTAAFAAMGRQLGYRNFTFAPYDATEYWKQVKTKLGPMVDRVYLQCYAGGEGNDPRTWSRQLGMPVDPGLWCRNGNGCADGDSPTQVSAHMRQWRNVTEVPGGFIWLYDDILTCAKTTGYSAADYARAINTTLARTTAAV